MTDHSSPSPDQNALLQPVENRANKIVTNQDDLTKRCGFCKKRVSSWLRNGFLRYDSRISVRDLPYLRPP